MSKYLLLPALILCASFSLAQEQKPKQQITEHQQSKDSTRNKKTETLAEVVIRANAQKSAVSAGKANIKPLDLPQSMAVITQSTLQNQQIANLTDILKNTNGVYLMGNTGGYQEEIASRGYALGSSNTFKNGVRYFNGMPTETSGIEKVEFLKGSAAILYGNVTAGGIINIITKKPKFEFGADASMTAASFDTYKTTYDIYGGVGKGKNMAFRIDGSNSQGNSFRKGVSSESKYINPSFLINFNPKTSLLLEADYQKDNRTADFGAGIVNYELVDLPRDRFVGVSWGYIKSEQAAFTTTLKHNFNDNWNLNFVNSLRYYTTDLFANTRPNTVLSTPANAAPVLSVDADGNWKRGIQRNEVKDNYWLQEINLKGNFKTWKFNHQFLVGVDTDTYKTTTLASVYKNPAKNYTNEYDIINIFSTDLSTTRNDVPNMDKNTLTTAPVKRVGAYAQDLIHFNKYFKALLGVRYSYQDTENEVYTYAVVNPTPKPEKTVLTNQYDDAFSPRFGLIFQPNDKQSIFASYSNSFVPNTGLDYNTKTALKPSTIHQYEVGVKNELFRERLYANLTLYQIENNNLAQTSLIDANFRELAGGTKSKGVEIDLVAYPVKGLTVIGGYSFTEIKYTASNIFIVGSTLLYMPKNTANLNFNYNVESGKLKGLNFGLINVYIGERYAGRSTNLVTVNDPRKPVRLPDYIQNDLALGYKFNQFSVRAKMSNVFNVLSYNVHDDNSVNPIAPTNYALTLNYTF